MTHSSGTFLGLFLSIFLGDDVPSSLSPQMRSYASFWWNWDGGWLHRWGDQQFWSHALYVTNATRMSRVRHDGVVVGGDVISLEHHRQHREFVHTGGR